MIDYDNWLQDGFDEGEDIDMNKCVDIVNEVLQGFFCEELERCLIEKLDEYMEHHDPDFETVIDMLKDAASKIIEGVNNEV